MANPTLRDVATTAGVHAATASRALNPKTRGLVNAETAKRVIRVAESLGYRPNPIARSLKTAKSATIGVVIPDLTNPIFPPIMRGIEDALGSSGYNPWIVNTDNDFAREEILVDSLRNLQVEGLIFATARREHPLLARLRENDVRMVLVNRKVDGLGIPTVTADDAAGVIAVVHHLAELGHTRIAFLGGPLSTSSGYVRKVAFRQAMSDRGLEYDPAIVTDCEAWAENAGAVGAARLLDGTAPFTAMIAGNDLIALGVYDELRARGLRCPEDLSIVGFNDMPYIDKLDPPLTTVRVPLYEIGTEAARAMLELIDEPGRPIRSVLLPVKLVERGSTGPRR